MGPRQIFFNEDIFIFECLLSMSTYVCMLILQHVCKDQVTNLCNWFSPYGL